MMKSLVRTLTLILLFGAAVDLEAQRRDWNADPTERIQKQTESMKELLSLSDKQAEKVGEINLKYAKKMQAARAEMGEQPDRTAMRDLFMRMNKEQDEELKNIMTTAQFEGWQKMKAERMQQRRERRGKKGEGQGDNEPKKKTKENQR
ncbi:MAG: hypothetical protein AAFZ15_32585 [Bacteroidota bacterium]